ncbi:MAG: CHAD domain-containing protein [Rhodobacteraceae bacterium]|nr:CHAD domain-containing protein [Paracoccaceae bacterium]
MTYAFQPGDEDVEHGVRRIARELVAATLRELADGGVPLPTRVHSGRKAVKKLRGLLRLVRPAFDGYRSETEALRACAALLAPLREAEVRRATFRALGPGRDAAAAAIGARLDAALAEATAPGVLDRALAGYAEGLGALGRRARDWRIRPRGARALAGGLARTWRDAQAALAAVEAGWPGGSEGGGEGGMAPLPAEEVHLLRKRIKDHWYQARLMRPVWPERLDAEIAAFDRLGEALGQHQDLCDLIAHLGAGGTPLPAALAAKARDRAAGILAASLPEARRLLAGSPDDLVRRWQAWWHIWREETARAGGTVIRLPAATRSGPPSAPRRKAR